MVCDQSNNSMNSVSVSKRSFKNVKRNDPLLGTNSNIDKSLNLFQKNNLY